jgi:uncharacterized protein (TIGR03437 family)
MRYFLFAVATCAAIAQTPSSVTVINYSGYAPSGQPATALTAFPVAPGSIASAYGTFSTAPEAGLVASTLSPMPRDLGGLRVRVNNVDAPLYSASRGQINFVVPAATPTGRQTVEVLAGGNVVARGTVLVFDIGPGLATSNPQTQQAIAQNQDFSVNGPSAPARRGEIVQLYATGCGRTEPALQDGTPPPALSRAAGEVKVFFASVEGTVQFAGAHPQFPGICQINAAVPDRAFLTGRVPVYFTINGVPSNPLAIQVQ